MAIVSNNNKIVSSIAAANSGTAEMGEAVANIFESQFDRVEAAIWRSEDEYYGLKTISIDSGGGFS